jgi:hypothetical protein
MDSKQTRIASVAIACILAAWIVCPLLLSTREPALPISTAPLSFNAAEAHRMIREFATQFPHRVLGSIESRQATGYIEDHLGKLGYPISYSHFDARIARRSRVGRNVLAYKQGQSPEIIALVAHLDTAGTTVQGAMDNGSGVGVLLELARIFSATPTRRSLLIVFSDGEEWGSLGARDLAGSYPERKRIAAVLSMDHLAIGDLSAFCLEETGQLKGFTPPWLRQLVRQAAGSQGLPVNGPHGLSEYFERAILISWADQGPFLNVGIPAINLSSESKDRSREKAISHTAQDTIEKLQETGIARYGLAAERIVRTLDELPLIPIESQSPFRLWGALYLKQGTISALQIISFLPLALIFCFYLKNYRKGPSWVPFGREFLAFLGTLLPFWIIYFLIQLACALRLLPTYSLYPATFRDPVLKNPSWAVLAGIAVTTLFVALVCFIIVKFSLRSLPKPDFNHSKLVLLALLLIEVVLALFYNAYWASIFLLLPAWIWALVGGRRTPGPLALNRLLVLAAGAVYYVVLWLYASRLDMSWHFVWYQVLALGNGLFTKAAFLLSTAMIALGIRFFAIQSHES